MDLHHTAVKEETGFSAVEMLLYLIAVTLITFVGYYVYHTKNAADKTYASAITQSSRNSQKTSSSNDNVAKLLMISEWGVQLSYAPQTKVSYIFHKGGSSSSDGTITYAQDAVDLTSDQYNNLKNADGHMCQSVDDTTGKGIKPGKKLTMVRITRSAADGQPSNAVDQKGVVDTIRNPVIIGSYRYDYTKVSRYHPGCSILSSGNTDMSIIDQEITIKNNVYNYTADLIAIVK